jgi:DNA-binding CsgD family transcriptional regulator
VAKARGDISSERAVVSEALGLARAAGRRSPTADALNALAVIARGHGDLQPAAAQHLEALDLSRDSAHPRGVEEALEGLGGIECELGRLTRAVRLLAAGHALRVVHEHPRMAADQARFAADLTRVGEGLGPERYEHAWHEGSGLSLDDAVEYARKGRGARGRARTGWHSLTRSEMKVARLASQGMRNAEIAARLFISPHTVTTHMARILAKLELTSRAQLAHVAIEPSSPSDPNGAIAKDT